MKKFVTVLLAFAMTLSCAAPALAAEDPNVDYAALQAQIDELYARIDELYGQVEPLVEQMNSRYADYFEIYGDTSDWDDEDWALTESWDEYQWAGYEAGANAYWEDYWQQDYNPGPRVRVGGVYMEESPIAVDGVSYLPREVLLTALGLDKTDVGTVTLDGVACLPIRPVAEAAGWEVDWSMWRNTVTVDNWEKLAAEIDENFTSLNAILQAAMNVYDPEKTYSARGTETLTATLYGETKHDAATFTADVSTLMNGDFSAMDAGYTIGLDMKDFEPLFQMVGAQDTYKDLQKLNKGSMRLRLDGDKGGMYFKSDLWSALGTDYLPDGKWMGMEDADFASAYLDIMAQMKDAFTIGGLLVESAKTGDDPYNSITGIRDACALLFGDDAFTQTKSGTTTTYTVKLDTLKIAKRAADLDLFTLEDLTGVLGETGLPTIDLTLTAKVAGEKLADCTLKGKLSIALFTVEMDMKSTPTASNVTMALKSRYLGKIEIAASSKIGVTSQRVPGAPEDFLSYEKLMEDYYNSLRGNYEDL